MRILVSLAVDAEFAPWRKLRKFEAIDAGDVTLHRTQIGRASVDFVITGMGHQNSRRAAESAMSAPHTICICTGFAGALKPEFKPGDILVARAVQMLGNRKTLECASGLATSAYQDGARLVRMFLTSERVVATAEEKARLAPFADAVDMESFAVLSAAQERSLPAVAIRVISDRFDEDMPADIGMTVDEKGRVSVGGVIRHIATHPLSLPALVRLGRNSRAAAEALANFLDAHIKALSFKTHGWSLPEVQEIAAT